MAILRKSLFMAYYLQVMTALFIDRWDAYIGFASRKGGYGDKRPS